MTDHTLDLLEVLQQAAKFHRAAVHCKHADAIEQFLHTHLFVIETHAEKIELECIDGRLHRLSVGVEPFFMATADTPPPTHLVEIHQALKRQATLIVPPALRKVGSNLTVQPQP